MHSAWHGTPAATPLDVGARRATPASPRAPASAVALQLGLLGVLTLWTAITLYNPNQHVTIHLSPLAQASCFVQPLLLWALSGLLLLKLASLPSTVALGAVFAFVNGLAVIHVIDARCKDLFMQPLSVDVGLAVLVEASVLWSFVATFLGGTFWWVALASLIAMNVAALLAARSARLRSKLQTETRRATTPLLALTAVLAVIAVFVPRQPSRLDEAVLVKALIAPFRLHAHSWAVLDTELAPECDQPAAPIASSAAREQPLWGAARGHNVVLFIGETWGYHETSLGDPRADRTPTLRRLAELGPIATAARTQSGLSTKAIYGVLTGRYSSPSFEIVESLHTKLDSLARDLADAGYETIFASTQQLTWQNIRNQFLSMGYQRVLGAHELRDAAERNGRRVPRNSFGIDDTELLRDGILPPVGARPFFITYYTMNTHVPYFVPGPEPPNERPIDRYRRALRYSDSVLQKLVDLLRQRGQLEKTLFVILGDHGENFTPNGKWSPRGCRLTEAEHLVPLVIAAPGLPRPALDAARTLDYSGARQIDIAPTILHLLGLPSRSAFQGRSLFDGRPPPASYANSWGECRVAGLVEGTTKRVFDFDENRAWLIDLARDPHGRHPKELTGPEKTALARRLHACSQYNDAALRAALPD